MFGMFAASYIAAAYRTQVKPKLVHDIDAYENRKLLVPEPRQRNDEYVYIFV
jgi:hypothetical protein